MRRIRNIKLNDGAAKEGLFEHSTHTGNGNGTSAGNLNRRNGDENYRIRSIFDDLALNHNQRLRNNGNVNGNNAFSPCSSPNASSKDAGSRPDTPDSTTKMLESSLDTYDENDSPNDGSSSSMSSLSTMEELAQDLHFSIPSNILFFAGSVVYLILAKMDLDDGEYYYSQQYYDKGGGQADDGEYYGYYDDSYSWSDPYTILSVIGSVCFIINPTVDIYRCFHYKNKTPGVDSLWHEDLRSDSASALFFGIAAMIDLWASLPTNAADENDQVETATLVSTHIYLLSALAAMMGVDIRCCSGIAVLLGLVGDLLFLIGSVIDVSISYVSDPLLISMDPKILLKLSLLSSSLWLVDSILYLLSNLYVLFRLRRERQKENEGVSPSGMELEYSNDELHVPDWFVYV